jgi:Flp pilus assembly protein TadD
MVGMLDDPSPVEDNMRSTQKITWLLIALMVLSLLAACSRDPKVRRQKYLDSGERYYDQGKYREAAIQFSNAVQVDSKWAEGHYRLGLAYLNLQNWQGAFAEFSRAVSLDENHLVARVNLGALLLAGGDPGGASEQANFVLSKQPDNPDALALKANIAQAQGKGQEALTVMDKALEHSDDPQLFFNMALLQARNRNLAQTEQYLKKAAELDKKNPRMRLALAALYVSQQRWDEAEQQLKLAIQLAPKEFTPRQSLASFYLMRKQNDRALEVLQKSKAELPDDSMALRGVANFYFETGDVEKAISEYNALVQQHPKDDGLKKAEIIVLLGRNRNDEARKLVEALEKSNPEDIEARLFRSDLLMRDGKPSDAARILEKVVKDDANNPVAHHQLGQAMMAMGNNDGAEAEFRSALKLQPNMLPSLRTLARLALLKKDMGTVEQCADQIIKLQPGAYDGYILRAIVEDNHKEDEKSLADLQKAVSLAPDSVDARNELGNWYGAHKRPTEARKRFEEALKLDANSVDAMLGLMKVFNAENDPKGAVKRLHAQIAVAPNNAAFYTMLGQLLARMNDLSGAESALEKAIQLQDKNGPAYGTLSGVQLAQGKVDASIATTDRWIAVSPTDVMAYMTKGSLMERKGDSNQALVQYQKVLQIKPDFPMAANNAAYLMLQQGKDLDVALTLAQTGRRGMPNSPYTADTLGWAYYQEGTYRLAVDLLQEATKQVPSNANYHYHLGMAYSKINDRAKAKTELERALQLNPNLAQAPEARRVLQELGRT